MTRLYRIRLGVVLTDIGNTSAREWISIEIGTKFNLIHEQEWTGNSSFSWCSSL